MCQSINKGNIYVRLDWQTQMTSSRMNNTHWVWDLKNEYIQMETCCLHLIKWSINYKIILKYFNYLAIDDVLKRWKDWTLLVEIIWIVLSTQSSLYFPGIHAAGPILLKYKYFICSQIIPCHRTSPSRLQGGIRCVLWGRFGMSTSQILGPVHLRCSPCLIIACVVNIHSSAI